MYGYTILTGNDYANTDAEKVRTRLTRNDYANTDS